MLPPQFLMKSPSLVQALKRLDGSPLPYLAALAVLSFVVLFGAHFWLANDDIHMAMIAHGYGFTGTPGPGLVYSNVIWGWLVTHLGVIFGTQGYTLGAYLLLAASCAALVYALRSAAVGATLGAAVVLCMFANNTLEMQFSITAGYLAVAGFALALSGGGESKWPWIAAALFLFTASLIRLEESLFVWVIASPFCLLRFLKARERSLRLRWIATLAAALLAIGLGVVINRAYYSGPQWQQFNQINKLRHPFTDYGLGRYYLQDPTRLAQSKLSVNDLKMLGNWFYADPNVYNAANLEPLIKGVSLSERVRLNLPRFHNTLDLFKNYEIAALLGLFAFGFALCTHRKTALVAFLLLLAVMGVFLALGRPGVVRVYPPAVAGLAVFTLIACLPRRHVIVSAASLLLLCACAAWSFNIYASHIGSQAKAERGAREACMLPSDQLQVVWGVPAGLQERYVYRPFSPPGGECKLQLYVLGVLQLMPANLETLHHYTGGKDLVQALLDHQPLYFLTDRGRLRTLALYMQEHYGVHLQYTELISQKSVQQYRVQVPE